MTTIPLQPNENSCRAAGWSRHVLTLPVAPRGFFRIWFEPIDSPARALPPAEALNWLEENFEQGREIRAIDMDGPGDPLGEIECTMETLRLVRKRYSDIVLSVTTLGLYAEDYAQSLAAAGVTNVTLLVDAVERGVAEKLYAWIRPGRKTIPLPLAIALLLDEQLRAVKAFKDAGCQVTIRTTVYPEYNDFHIEEIARVMAGCGAVAMTLVPCKTAVSQEDHLIRSPAPQDMQRLRHSAAKHLEVFLVGEKEFRIGTDCSSPHGAGKSGPSPRPGPSLKRPNVAVVSAHGIEVDLHLGQACQVLIYGPREDGLVCLLSTRPVPAPGSGSSRWEALAESLDDCFVLLAASAGESPRRILADRGITVLITDNEIEGTVDVLFGGKKKGKREKKEMQSWPYRKDK